MKKRIVCFGDSNTWGYNARTLERFPEEIRWPSLLGAMLGDDYQIVEEGLPGRTSVVDDPIVEGMNAYPYIHPCLMSHSPIELVIIMLGTNDTKARFNLTSYNIAQGITRLAHKAKNTPAGVKGSYPKVLVIAPPPIGRGYDQTDVSKTMGLDCDRKSEEFPHYLADLLKIQEIDFLNTKELVQMNEIDYMHLNEEGHKQLAELVFHKLKSSLLT